MAAAAVRTENRISDAFKLEMPGSKAVWDSTVGGTAYLKYVTDASIFFCFIISPSI